MAPKVSKSKAARLEKKSKGGIAQNVALTESSRNGSSAFGSEASTPLTSLSVAGSKEDLSTSMAKLAVATNRCVYAPLDLFVLIGALLTVTRIGVQRGI